MGPERRRSPRSVVVGDGARGVLRGFVPVSLRDISAGGLRLRLASELEPGGIYPLTAFLRGLSLVTPVRVTRCRPGEAGPGRDAGWDAGAEFLFRDDGDAAALRRWLERPSPA